jgi:hypothetical protein
MWLTKPQISHKIIIFRQNNNTEKNKKRKTKVFL